MDNPSQKFEISDYLRFLRILFYFLQILFGYLLTFWYDDIILLTHDEKGVKVTIDDLKHI